MTVPSTPTLPGVPAWQLSATALGAHYAAGTLTPVDAMVSITARLAQVNPRLNAVISHRLADAMRDAEASAARWQAGTPLSALDGVPFTVKDNIPVQGLPCTWGSRLYANYLPDTDETGVARLRAAGMIVLGKTNVPEFTLQGYTDNLLFGATRNPWNLALTPGGSSGGAVACVAAGIGPVALGTDGGGSIRRPCSHTGLVGLKPGTGTVPREHGLPEILPGMEVIGPITRTVADAAAILHLLTETPLHDRACTTSGQAKLVQEAPLRIAYVPDLEGDPVDPEIALRIDAVAAAFAAMGHSVQQLDPPELAGAIQAINTRAWPVISQTGLVATLNAVLPTTADMTPALHAMAEAGRTLSAVDLFTAQGLVRHLQRVLHTLFQTTDLLLLPSAAALPWPAKTSHPDTIAGLAVGPRGHAVFTAFVNAAGLPAINLPAAPTDAGMPIGFQLVGPQGSEARLLAVAAAFEAAHPWSDRWPAL